MRLPPTSTQGRAPPACARASQDTGTMPFPTPCGLSITVSDPVSIPGCLLPLPLALSVPHTKTSPSSLHSCSSSFSSKERTSPLPLACSHGRFPLIRRLQLRYRCLGGRVSRIPPDSALLTPQLLAHRLHTRALAQNTRDTRRNPLGRGTSRMSHVDDHMPALSLSLAFFRQSR